MATNERSPPTFIDLNRLRAILAEYPTLSTNGLASPEDDAEPSRNFNLECVCAALEWISDRCEMTKRINRKQSSYGLKHVMEEQSGKYTANGEFILAALLLGYRTDEPNELNPFFNLKVRPIDPKPR